MLYALSYNIIYFIQELFLALGKQWIGLTAYLYHNNHNWEGSDPRDQLMQGSGALAIFILGIILLFVYWLMRDSRSWWTLFVLWLTHHALIQSLPQLSTAPMDPGSDTGQAMVYLDMPGAVNIALAAASMLAIIGLSYLFQQIFLALRTRRTVYRSSIRTIQNGMADSNSTGHTRYYPPLPLSHPATRSLHDDVYVTSDLNSFGICFCLGGQSAQANRKSVV